MAPPYKASSIPLPKAAANINEAAIISFIFFNKKHTGSIKTNSGKVLNWSIIWISYAIPKAPSGLAPNGRNMLTRYLESKSMLRSITVSRNILLVTNRRKKEIVVRVVFLRKDAIGGPSILIIS